MKELSIEEKAKRYDEILARAKGANIPYYKEDVMSKVKEFVDYLLPELAESEDERIRKQIKMFIISHSRNESDNKIDSWLAWLEKQGEQKAIKHNNDATIDSNLNDYCCKVYSALHKENGGNLSFARLQHLAMDIYKWCKEQQKSIEWSEEDLCNIERCITKVEIDKSKWENNGKAKTMVDADDELISWLKSLKDRVQPQPKQEWDGGDEAHLHSLITHLEQWIERHPNTTGADIQGENITWLKSLRPQMQWKAVDKEIYVKEPALAQRKDKSEPNHGYVICYDHTLTPDVYERFIMISDIYNQSHWKPSDEQMNALNYVVNLMASSERPTENDLYYNILKSLRQQLMKLKDEK